MLPAKIPNARIFSWGYDANTHSTSQLTAMYLYDHAQNLVSDLTKFAYETYPTPLVFGKTLMVVPKSSAVVPGAVDVEAIAIMENHTNMVKFASEADSGFRKVAGHLMLMVEEAPAKVLRNWETEG